MVEQKLDRETRDYLRERLEVLNNEQHNLQGRLLAIDISSAVLDRADKIEAEGRRLLDAADRIRKQLSEDTIAQDRLESELFVVQLEITLSQYCLRAGVKPSGSLRKLLTQCLVKAKNELGDDA